MGMYFERKCHDSLYVLVSRWWCRERDFFQHLPCLASEWYKMLAKRDNTLANFRPPKNTNNLQYVANLLFLISANVHLLYINKPFTINCQNHWQYHRCSSGCFPSFRKTIYFSVHRFEATDLLAHLDLSNIWFILQSIHHCIPMSTYVYFDLHF